MGKADSIHPGTHHPAFLQLHAHTSRDTGLRRQVKELVGEYRKRQELLGMQPLVEIFNQKEKEILRPEIYP